jgi:hypothetical protein
VRLSKTRNNYLGSETIIWKRNIRALDDWFHITDRILRSADLSGRAVLDL